MVNQADGFAAAIDGDATHDLRGLAPVVDIGECRGIDDGVVLYAQTGDGIYARFHIFTRELDAV